MSRIATYVLVVTLAVAPQFAKAEQWQRIVYRGAYHVLDEDDKTKSKVCAIFWFEDKTFRLEPMQGNARNLVGIYGNTRYGAWGPIVSPGCRIGEKKESVPAPMIMRTWNVMATPAGGGSDTYNVEAAFFNSKSSFTHKLSEPELRSFKTKITIRNGELTDHFEDRSDKVRDVFKKPGPRNDRPIFEAVRKFIVDTHQGNCMSALAAMSKVVTPNPSLQEITCNAAAERRKLIGDVVSVGPEELVRIDEWDVGDGTMEKVGGARTPKASAFMRVLIQFERIKLSAAGLVDLSDPLQPTIIMLL